MCKARQRLQENLGGSDGDYAQAMQIWPSILNTSTQSQSMSENLQFVVSDAAEATGGKKSKQR